MTVPTGVADHAHVAAAVERIESEIGPIDLRVNACRVGSSTVGTPMANAVAPGSSQQAGECRQEDDPVDLRDPADGADGRDFGARGAFESKARYRSAQQWVSHRYPQVATAVAAGAVGGLAVWASARRP